MRNGFGALGSCRSVRYVSSNGGCSQRASCRLIDLQGQTWRNNFTYRDYGSKCQQFKNFNRGPAAEMCRSCNTHHDYEGPQHVSRDTYRGYEEASRCRCQRGCDKRDSTGSGLSQQPRGKSPLRGYNSCASRHDGNCFSGQSVRNLGHLSEESETELVSYDSLSNYASKIYQRQKDRKLTFKESIIVHQSAPRLSADSSSVLGTAV